MWFQQLLRGENYPQSKPSHFSLTNRPSRIKFAVYLEVFNGLRRWGDQMSRDSPYMKAMCHGMASMIFSKGLEHILSIAEYVLIT